MPIFEYQCIKCGSRFEEIVIGKSDQETVCPDCGSDQTRKLMSAFSWSGADGTSGASACSSCSASASACKSCSSK